VPWSIVMELGERATNSSWRTHCSKMIKSTLTWKTKTVRKYFMGSELPIAEIRICSREHELSHLETYSLTTALRMMLAERLTSQSGRWRFRCETRTTSTRLRSTRTSPTSSEWNAHCPVSHYPRATRPYHLDQLTMATTSQQNHRLGVPKTRQDHQDR